MVRTIQTTRTNTNYIPPPWQVPVYPVVVKEIPVDLPRIRAENRVILEDSSEEFLPTPTPLAESLAFTVGSSLSALLAPAVQAPAPGGDDPDDSGDDDEDNKEEEEEELGGEHQRRRQRWTAGPLRGVMACHRTLYINVRDRALP